MSYFVTKISLILLTIAVTVRAEEEKLDEEIDKYLETPPEYLKIVNNEYLKKNQTKRAIQEYFDGSANDLDVDENKLLSILNKKRKKKLDDVEKDQLAEDELAQFLLLFGGNPDETSSGEAIVDGDIAFHKPDEKENDGAGLQMRKATANPVILWPSKTLKYEFHSTIKPQTRRIIEDAMEHWEEHTCLKFKEKEFYDIWYIRFRNDLSGCYSYIGNVLLTLRGQDVSIGKGCEHRDIVIHEIGHAVGFFHEQARSDRQEYAVLLPENISPRMHPQFNQQRDNNHDTPYDYTSIMHYPSMAFSKRMYERNTLVTKDPHYQRLMGKYSGLTFRDRKIANSLYDCNEDCPNLYNTTCQNEGYLKPYRPEDPSDCECDCPPGTSGEYCEVVDGDYYATPICGGNITEPTEIQTPNYPERLNPYEDCSWWIQAPEGQKVRVTFLDFSFDKRLDKKDHPFNGLCTAERVEIRSKDRYRGDMYCGEDIEKGQIMESKGTEFIVLITANAYKQGRGLKAEVSFF